MFYVITGYIWMVRVPGKEGKGALKVITTSNQDSPVMEGLQPLVCIDMWEHAYYLKHNYKYVDIH
jgi:Fe-Mn family superoxide dismutase